MNEAKIMQLVDELKAELSKPDEPKGRKLEVGDWVIVFYHKKFSCCIKIYSISAGVIYSEVGNAFATAMYEIFYAPMVLEGESPFVISDYDYCNEYFERVVI
jgi:hypothetical protein